VTRSCPKCGRSYADEVFFCGHDGTITVQDQTSDDFDPRLGKQLGGYIVVARVADGAMGRVFEGRHPETRARVAIKVLHADVATDAIAVERFKREYESASEMANDHVVKVLEFGETPDGSWFMTMEYLVGLELGKALEEGQEFSPARIVRIVSQVAEALEYAHSFGFIHRDLKPDNIFLCTTDHGDEVRVLDFGSVKLQMELGAKLTAIGTTLGSPFYMSPEQAMGRSDVDQRTDVFAVGAILYEMLTGKVAFDAPNVAKILMRIMNENPDPPSASSGCPTALDHVVERALKKDKEARYASARELAEAVAIAYGLEGDPARWARTSEVELARALETATPREAPAFGESLRPRGGAGGAPPPGKAAGPGAGAAAVAGVAAAARVGSLPPKLSLSEQDTLPPGARPGLGGRAMALIAVGVLALCGMLALLLR